MGADRAVVTGRPRRRDHPGRKRLDDRKVLCGILFVLYTGIPWEFLPQELGFGSGMTCLQRSLRHASLAAAARTDAKTGLLNAGAWQREAAVEVTRAAPAQTPLAVAIADIDHFKAVNDTYGHLAGDAVLAAVSAAMRDLLRDCDLCGRFGGEEFALLLPRTTAAQALEITERIRQGISQLAIPRDGTTAVRVTISIGVALPSQARHTLDDLLAAADHALYQAKRSGRDRVIMHSDTRVPHASQPLPLARTNVPLG
jgi:diguanylate cyclase (GGDEF)-like protein